MIGLNSQVKSKPICVYVMLKLSHKQQMLLRCFSALIQANPAMLMCMLHDTISLIHLKCIYDLYPIFAHAVEYSGKDKIDHVLLWFISGK